ncbi:MAG: Helix-turn-helix domain [Thermoanaerobacteraceae bacterium]|nr:Helix-turn-helix domain [Thermoanaerobacteraceae bacterium]
MNKKIKVVLKALREQEETIHVGERIKALREKSGETQESIAKYLKERGFKKASRQLVSAIETGKQHPNLKMLVAFADHFNVSVDFLLGRISYQTDRDRQFEQFMLMYRKAIEDQPWDVREYFNTSINEIYWILSRVLEYGQKDKLSRFADILSELRVLVYNATEILDKGKDDVNKILTGLKIMYEEKERVLSELSAIISDLAIPFDERPKVNEFQTFADTFNNSTFDEE